MSPYKVGYGKPPVHTQFKKGVCPNPKGRGRRQFEPGGLIESLLEEVIVGSINGKKARCSRYEVIARSFISKAVQGNIAASLQVLKLLASETRLQDSGTVHVHITGGLPDL